MSLTSSYQEYKRISPQKGRYAQKKRPLFFLFSISPLHKCWAGTSIFLRSPPTGCVGTHSRSLSCSSPRSGSPGPDAKPRRTCVEMRAARWGRSGQTWVRLLLPRIAQIDQQTWLGLHMRIECAKLLLPHRYRVIPCPPLQYRREGVRRHHSRSVVPSPYSASEHLPTPLQRRKRSLFS